MWNPNQPPVSIDDAPDRLGAGSVSEGLDEEGREDDPLDEDEDGQADAEDPECPGMAHG